MINTGDNFYNLGISAELGVADPQWNSSFSNIYSASSLKARAPPLSAMQQPCSALQ